MLPTTQPAAALTDLVDSLKEAWRGGAPPDAAGALREYPELLAQRSLVVDLAYEEYCLLEEAGHPPEAEEFCRRLPAYVSQVREVLRGHRLLADHPELFVAADTDWPHPEGDFEGLSVVRELGKGAFARAYLARDPATGDRPVVLKLSPAPSDEARTLGPIDHPHVVTVYWAKRVRGLHAICMPFVGATTLGDVIATAFPRAARGPARSARTILGAIDPATGTRTVPLLTGRESYPDAVTAVVARLAGALAHLHRGRVSHGDLKPSNIILAPGAHPYLIDFNLATAPDGALQRLGGTLPYMAPERIRFLLRDVRESGPAAATDVYSLGAVFFEALTGRVPVEPANLADAIDVARDLLQRQTAAGRDAGADVPPALARIVARCLDPNPDNRPTAEDLERELVRYLRRRVVRSRLAGAVLACVGLAATGFVAWQPTVVTQPNPAAPVEPESVAVPPKPPPAAVPPRPLTAADSFNRGVERLRAGDLGLATKDFGDARRLQPDGPSTAYLAYCTSREGRDGVAAALYLKAIKDHNYKPAWVHCNRADSLIRCPSSQNFQHAIEEADAALALEPNLRAARLNRMSARFLSDLDTKTQTLANPSNCLDDLEAVMANGPCTGALYYTAALVLTAAGREHHDRAVSYLREAARCGRNPQQFAGEKVFEVHLAGRSDFVEVTRLPPAERPEQAVNLSVVDPPGR